MPMDRQTGGRIDVLTHIGQCVQNIVLTQLNTRPMWLDYGANLIDIVDQVTNTHGRAVIVAATAEAVTRWETRPSMERITIAPSADGSAPVTLRWSYDGADQSTTAET